MNVEDTYKMDLETKDELIYIFLNNWAYAEYKIPLHQAVGRSKGAREEFERLSSMLSELIDKVERISQKDLIKTRGRLMEKKKVNINNHKTGGYNLDGSKHKKQGHIPPLWLIMPGDESKDYPPGWYFCDEAEQLNGPFGTIDEAAEAFKQYVP